ncbi:MAG: hypothetical protein HUJ71_05445 [Pseudobutyrivibrio sp.]|nr:hypothetical protein [Pseudobutyrivibrio sp.]
MKTKSILLKTAVGILCAFCVVTSATTFSQASSYTAYSLGRNKTNNFTSMHEKTTSDNYISNQVTAITNTSYANFWAVNNKKSRISSKYKQGVGTGSCKLIFTSSDYDKEGTQVGMGMEDYQIHFDYAFVSGTVDFR